MATLEEFQAECRSELQALRDGDGIFKQVNNERLPISDDDFEQMVIDCANSKFDNQENGWLKNRLEHYPSVQECIHALLDGGDTLTDLQLARQLVKDTYPKP
jgi:hypothetical protein